MSTTCIFNTVLDRILGSKVSRAQQKTKKKKKPPLFFHIEMKKVPQFLT